jgi:hypothetical protein
MPKWLMCFCGAFVCFFTWGGYEEYNARHELTDDAYILQVTAAYFLNPQSLKEPRRSYDSGRYQYLCRGEVVAVFNPSTNVISLNERRNYTGPETKAELSNLEIVSLFTGISVVEVITQIREGGLSKKELAGALAGAFSGYNLGRWALSRTRPSCDAEEITRRLGTPTFGPQLSREMLRQILDKYCLIVDGQLIPLASETSLLKLEQFAATMPPSNRTWGPAPGRRPGVFDMLPRLNTYADLDAVCKALRALLVRLSAANYNPQLDDFVVALYPRFIARWLGVNRSASQQTYPKFQGLGYMQDPTEDPRIKWLREQRAGPLGWLAYSLYVAMFIVGGFVVIVGIIGIVTWLKRVHLTANSGSKARADT